MPTTFTEARMIWVLRKVNSQEPMWYMFAGGYCPNPCHAFTFDSRTEADHFAACITARDGQALCVQTLADAFEESGS